MLKLVNATKKFVSERMVTTALNNISLEIRAGEYIAVTGPSGCGKSTLLSVLGLLDTPDCGEYWFDGANVAGYTEVRLNELRRGRISFVFQSFNLIEELSVGENVELAVEYSDLPLRERRQRVREILAKFDIGHRASHRPWQLSGGQQQRVAIARALITRPALLLADEPTGNLDSAHGEEVMRMLQQINDEGTTIVMVTHSPSHAARASRTVRMINGATVQATGT